jgi:hypothetical protein
MTENLNVEDQVQDQVIPDQDVSETPKDTGPFQSEMANRILAAYAAIDSESEDIRNRLASLMSITNNYGYALTIANEVNSRQGKMRYVYSDDERTLMSHSYEPDVNPTIDSQLEELFIYMVDSYLAMHSDLSDSEEGSNTWKYHVNSVKTVLIMLFKNNQYGIIPKLHVPDWAQQWVVNAIEAINDKQEEVYFEWITYLSESGNEELVDTVKSVGIDFFKVSKAINTFYKYFKDKIANIKNYDEVYAKFLELRDEYIKASTNITQKSLYPIFETTDDTFNKRKKTVINEFQQMFQTDEHAILLKRLIFGSDPTEDRNEFKALLAAKEEDSTLI